LWRVDAFSHFDEGDGRGVVGADVVFAFEPVGVGTGLFVGVLDVPERVVTGGGPLD
jgi:hypothetical protein